MINWRTISSRLGVVDLETIYDVLDFNAYIGQRVDGFSSVLGDGQFILLKGAANIEKGDFVTYNNLTGAVAPTFDGTDKNSGAPVAVAVVANTDPNKYSWYQVCGNAIAQSDGTVVANSPIYIKASTGLIDDSVNLGGQILGARSATAKAVEVNGHTLAANELVVTINSPAIQGGADA